MVAVNEVDEVVEVFRVVDVVVVVVPAEDVVLLLEDEVDDVGGPVTNVDMVE